MASFLWIYYSVTVSMNLPEEGLRAVAQLYQFSVQGCLPGGGEINVNETLESSKHEETCRNLSFGTRQ